MRAWCRWCKYRIRWYARWGAWGTATGDQEHATHCPSNTDGTLHEPVQDKPTLAEEEARIFVELNTIDRGRMV